MTHSIVESSIRRFGLILLLGLLVPALSMAQSIDTLLKGGHVIDPKNGINEVMDVAITDGVIHQVAENIDESQAEEVIDVNGLYVTPGLIDLHTHVYFGTTDNLQANSHVSLPADAFSFRAGVTTMVDAGSSGWKSFEHFKETAIDRAQTRILAFLHIGSVGMVSRYEAQNVDDMNPVMTAYMITRMYPEIIVGVKSPHYWGDFTQVEKAVEAGNLADVPVMVDFGGTIPPNPPNSIESLFMDYLRPGDIFTHAYSYQTRGRETIVDEDFNVKPFIFDAEEKGIVFDVGHGGGALSFRQAQPAIEQGLLPMTISSDLHIYSMNSGMKNMANLLSKFMAIGMSLEEVITASTWQPANVIQRPDLGHLSVGAEADIAVFNLREGNFGFTDVRRTKVYGDRKLEAELTFRAGRLVWDLNGRSMPLWEDAL
ncbi:MAG: amidohydrolase/deacetylase family metallohydrolase [Bacteroidota bacterium]